MLVQTKGQQRPARLFTLKWIIRILTACRKTFFAQILRITTCYWRESFHASWLWILILCRDYDGFILSDLARWVCIFVIFYSKQSFSKLQVNFSVSSKIVLTQVGHSNNIQSLAESKTKAHCTSTRSLIQKDQVLFFGHTQKEYFLKISTNISNQIWKL